MTATAGRRSPFELVDPSDSHPTAYTGVERRRSRPLVVVSDRLAEARRGTWSVTVLRMLFVIALWTTFAAPRLMDPSLVMVRTGVPLVYLIAELIGLAIVLRYQARLARAATLY